MLEEGGEHSGPEGELEDEKEDNEPAIMHDSNEEQDEKVGKGAADRQLYYRGAAEGGMLVLSDEALAAKAREVP
eukprot:926803-Amphidinium_carterae.1